MNVTLIDVDSKIPNLALMKLSAWHKAHGDRVQLIRDPDDVVVTPDADLVCSSSIFDFSSQPRIITDGEIRRGGTGVDLSIVLTQEQDMTYPDYTLYRCEYALGRVSRGCIRRCPWCVVWRQDGRVHQVGELSDFWRGQTHLRLIDDNLTALPELFLSTCEELSKRKVITKFEALDVRLMTPEMASALRRVRRWGRVHFAWDSMMDEEGVRRGIDSLKAGNFPLSKSTFYVLIGFNTTPEEDLYRVNLLDSLGVQTFAMPFERTPYTRAFARWVNAKPAFRSCTFDEYKRGWNE